MNRNSRLAIVVAAAAAVAACTVNQTEVPALTGPSEFAKSIRLSANPDTIALGQPGTSTGQQSLILATVFDRNGQPLPNQTVRFETVVNDNVSSCGQLSVTSAVTNADGRASTVFTAPGTPPDCASFNKDGSITVRATPVGTDFQATGAQASTVGIFMALPASASTGPLSVNFSIAPNPGTVGQAVTFSDAGSISPGHTIVSYVWTWSDGATKNGSTVTHDFFPQGTYTATLTVTDDIGQSGFKTALVQIN
jgi:PKD repeat protein